jgi:hypothetical protein
MRESLAPRHTFGAATKAHGIVPLVRRRGALPRRGFWQSSQLIILHERTQPTQANPVTRHSSQGVPWGANQSHVYKTRPTEIEKMNHQTATTNVPARPGANAHIQSEVIQTLHALIHERLFGGGPWLADREITTALIKKLDAMGLNEPVPEEPNSQRSTALGREVNIKLMEVFMGVWCEYEIPMILEEHGLLSEEETTEVYERFEGGESPEAVLLPLVRRAYIQHFQAGARVN